MKIAYTLDQVLRCGGVRVPFEHCRRLKELGHDAAIYAAGHIDDGVREWIERYKVEVRPISELAKGVDVLISVWWRQLDELLQYPAGKRFHLVQGRDLLSYPANHEWRPIIEAVMHRLDYQYLAVSDWAGQSCRNPVIIPNGVDSRFWAPPAFGKLNVPEFRILIEGSTIDPYKGVTEALTAAERFKADHANVKIWLMANVNNLPPSVDRHILAPNDVTIKSAYQNATVFLKTTHFDGFGLPHLEAMACGLPVITTDAGGNMSFCKDDQNCLVVPVGNVEKMVSALEAMHLSKAMRERLAQNAMMTARKWTWEQSVDKLLATIS